MRAEVERLALLADNTIVYGRTAAPAPVRLEEAVPDAIVDATIARYENLFAAGGSTIEVTHNAPRAGLFDRMSFERILINLIDNANKYAPGRILVMTDETNGTLMLSVRDFGRGLDPQTASEIDGACAARRGRERWLRPRPCRRSRIGRDQWRACEC